MDTLYINIIIHTCTHVHKHTHSKQYMDTLHININLHKHNTLNTQYPMINRSFLYSQIYSILVLYVHVHVCVNISQQLSSGLLNIHTHHMYTLGLGDIPVI